MNETLMYILTFGAFIIIILFAIGGFYLVMIMRDISKIVSRIDSLTKLSHDIASVPLYAILAFIKNNKWLKLALNKLRNKDEKEG